MPGETKNDGSDKQPEEIPPVALPPSKDDSKEGVKETYSTSNETDKDEIALSHSLLKLIVAKGGREQR